MSGRQPMAEASGDAAAAPDARPTRSETRLDRAALTIVRVFIAAFVAAVLLPNVSTAFRLLVFAIADPSHDLTDWHLAFLIRGTLGGVVVFIVVPVVCAVAIGFGITRRRTWMIGGAIITAVGGNVGLAKIVIVGIGVGGLTMFPTTLVILVGVPLLFDFVLGGLAGVLVWLIVRPTARRPEGPIAAG